MEHDYVLCARGVCEYRAGGQHGELQALARVRSQSTSERWCVGVHVILRPCEPLASYTASGYPVRTY